MLAERLDTTSIRASMIPNDDRDTVGRLQRAVTLADAEDRRALSAVADTNSNIPVMWSRRATKPYLSSYGLSSQLISI